MITNSKTNFINISKDAINLPDEESKKLLINMAYEDFLNAYDEACAKYLEEKNDEEKSENTELNKDEESNLNVEDKIRFKKTYNSEIRKVVENENSKRHLDPITTNYRSLLKVYSEWNNLEQ